MESQGIQSYAKFSNKCKRQKDATQDELRFNSAQDVGIVILHGAYSKKVGWAFWEINIRTSSRKDFFTSIAVRVVLASISKSSSLPKYTEISMYGVSIKLSNQGLHWMGKYSLKGRNYAKSTHTSARNKRMDQSSPSKRNGMRCPSTPSNDRNVPKTRRCIKRLPCSEELLSRRW